MWSKIAVFVAVCSFAWLGLSRSAEMQGAAPTIHKFRDIRRMDVKNAQGETLGDIEDVVVNTKSCKIVYMAMAHGEFLGFGGKLFAIAPSALRLSKDGKYFLLDHTPKEFQDAKGFDANDWPMNADARWGKSAGAKNADTDKGILRLTRIEGLHVRSPQAEDLGKIYDFALNLNDSSIAYAAVSTGTTLGLGGKLVAVPCQAFTLRSQKLDPARREFILNMTKQAFDQVASFPSNSWPTEANASFMKK